MKLFIFKFVNSYGSLFYIAFLKKRIEGACLENDCMNELAIQLGVLFVTNLSLNILLLGWP